MLQINYNPDVLSCLANLSNDEVFTPPKLVNEILDMLPQELFKSKETTFLDPVTKSGVFLREIAKRLNDGLKDQIPDQQERVNHIFTKQLYALPLQNLLHFWQDAVCTALKKPMVSIQYVPILKPKRAISNTTVYNTHGKMANAPTAEQAKKYIAEQMI